MKGEDLMVWLYDKVYGGIVEDLDFWGGDQVYYWTCNLCGVQSHEFRTELFANRAAVRHRKECK